MPENLRGIFLTHTVYQVTLIKDVAIFHQIACLLNQIAKTLWIESVPEVPEANQYLNLPITGKTRTVSEA